MNNLSKMNKPFCCVIASLVVALTVTSIKCAMAASLTPNAGVYVYNIAAGASTSPLTIPADRPVFLMGCCSTLGYRGVGQVTLERSAGSFLQWVGLDSDPAGTVTHGFSATSGTHIVQIDFSGQVNVNVSAPDAFLVTNTSVSPRSVYLTIMY